MFQDHRHKEFRPGGARRLAYLLVCLLLVDCLCDFGPDKDEGCVQLEDRDDSGCGGRSYECEDGERYMCCQDIHCPADLDWFWIGEPENGNFCCEDHACHPCCNDSHCRGSYGPDGGTRGRFCENYRCITCSPLHPCDQGQFCCSQDICAECCVGTDCPDYPREFCTPELRCETRCLRLKTLCPQEYLECCPGLVCDRFDGRCAESCLRDSQCQERDLPNAGDLLCLEGRCDYLPCGEDADCPHNKFCIEEDCLTLFECNQMAYCQIDPAEIELVAGQSVQFSAAAYDRDDKQLEVTGFRWTSFDPDILVVDENGVGTAVVRNGQTGVQALVLGCELTCQAGVLISP